MRVDFSDMPEYDLMHEIWDIDVSLGNGVSHMPDDVFDMFMNDQDNMIERLHGMIGDEDLQQFLMRLPGAGIMLKRLEESNG